VTKAILDDDVSIDEIQKAVEHTHGVPAKFVEAVEVDERFNCEIVWQGTAKAFALTGHPSGATKAYAWSYRTEGTRRKFKAVLGVPHLGGGAEEAKLERLRLVGEVSSPNRRSAVRLAPRLVRERYASQLCWCPWP
jgi:hypothetical protein